MEVGDVIAGIGGLRKTRFGDPRPRKGKRGGLRIIYFWWKAGAQFWLFTSSTRTRLITGSGMAGYRTALTTRLPLENEASTAHLYLIPSASFQVARIHEHTGKLPLT